jgi:hypothetical protein
LIRSSVVSRACRDERRSNVEEGNREQKRNSKLKGQMENHVKFALCHLICSSHLRTLSQDRNTALSPEVCQVTLPKLSFRGVRRLTDSSE